MGEHSAIQWCDDSVDPTQGCEGCELWDRGHDDEEEDVEICYAGQLHNRYGGHSLGYSPRFEQVTFWPGRMAEAAARPDLTGTRRLYKPWLDGAPRLIFVSAMSDALSKAVPFPYLQREIIEVVSSPAGRRHRWLWLTKRPRRMRAFERWLHVRGITWPANLWAGTSVTSTNTLGRIRDLEQVGPAGTIRFVSLEPQWGSVDLDLSNHRCIAWIIQGGMSGANAVPFGTNLARDVRDQCGAANVAYFLKQLGEYPVEHVDADEPGELVERNIGQREPLRLYIRGRQKRDLGISHRHGGDWREWPEDLRVRELPI